MVSDRLHRPDKLSGAGAHAIRGKAGLLIREQEEKERGWPSMVSCQEIGHGANGEGSSGCLLAGIDVLLAIKWGPRKISF